MLKSVNGFSAIEMAIVLSVSAMIMGGGLAAAKPVVEKVNKQKTERQMEKINDRLASFVHRNNRLPCPANPGASSEPFGSERGSSGIGAGSCTGTDAVGVVPFRALGLDEDDVRDSWGNLITYHVSPAFAINQADVGDNDHDQVHEFCRSEDWVTDPLSLPFDKWKLFGRAINCQSLNEIVSDDGQIRFYPEDRSKQFSKNNSIGDGTYGLGIRASYSGNEDGKYLVDDDENLIIEFDRATGVIDLKLKSLQVGSVLTFDVWGARDAADDDFETVSITLTQEMIDDTVANGGSVVDVDESGNVRQYNGFLLNSDSADANAIPVPNVVEIHKVRMNVSHPSGGAASYNISYIEGDYADNNKTVNINPAKARFCCPMAHKALYSSATDLRIVDESGSPVVPQTRSSDAGKYNNKDTEVPGSVASDIFVPAFALISHGPNSHGAFQSNGSGSRVTVSATLGEGFGSDEASNSDGDNVYVYRMPDSTKDATYFDDVVMWRTQDQVYSEFGNQTCQTP